MSLGAIVHCVDLGLKTTAIFKSQWLLVDILGLALSSQVQTSKESLFCLIFVLFMGLTIYLKNAKSIFKALIFETDKILITRSAGFFFRFYELILCMIE